MRGQYIKLTGEKKKKKNQKRLTTEKKKKVIKTIVDGRLLFCENLNHKSFANDLFLFFCRKLVHYIIWWWLWNCTMEILCASIKFDSFSLTSIRGSYTGQLNGANQWKVNTTIQNYKIIGFFFMALNVDIKADLMMMRNYLHHSLCALFNYYNFWFAQEIKWTVKWIDLLRIYYWFGNVRFKYFDIKSKID